MKWADFLYGCFFSKCEKYNLSRKCFLDYGLSLKDNKLSESLNLGKKPKAVTFYSALVISNEFHCHTEFYFLSCMRFLWNSLKFSFVFLNINIIYICSDKGIHSSYSFKYYCIWHNFFKRDYILTWNLIIFYNLYMNICIIFIFGICPKACWVSSSTKILVTHGDNWSSWL